MGQFKVLDLFKPARRILPNVQAPDNRVPFKKKFIYTLTCLGIFLVCSQLPLYGIKASTGADPLYWARMIMASSRGTVMELGTGPIITAGMIVQLLVGSKIVDVDQSVKSDRELM
jgi:protein transport protein SEC61 subunit alpha